ncbi:MAG: tetratricopeptide repeat protein [Planctomycetota bacterium]|jgi:tetratricopeptide (TPR) repeat protein
MRFDPQANFVQEDGDHQSVVVEPPMVVDHLPPGVSVRSPLKTALIFLALGFLGGGGYWIWNEGVPGVQANAAAEPPAGRGAGDAVILYAEALISGEMEAEITGVPVRRAAGGDTGGGRLSASQRRTRVREEYQEGRTLTAMGKHAEAVPHFAEAVRLDPSYADAHYRLGLAYVQVGDLKSAKHTRRELAKLDTDLATLLAHLIDD